MKVREIMRHEVRSVGPLTDLATVGRVMADVGCGFLPVVDNHNSVVGVLTDRDLALAVSKFDRKPSQIQVLEAMTRDVHGCEPNHNVRAALEWMGACKVRRLVVVGENRELVGILSLDDIVLQARALASGEFDGPLYADIAHALHAICEHPTPVLAT